MDNGSGAHTIEMSYRLGDLYAVMFQTWPRFLRVLLIAEVFWIVLIAIMNLFDGASMFEAVQWIYWPVLAWGALAVLVLWFGFCPIISYLRAKRRGFLGPVQISISERGVSIESHKIDSLVRWPAIRRVRRFQNRLFLFLTATSAFVVPRRAFQSDTEFETFADEADKCWRSRLTL